MISLADTLHPESVNLDLVAITAREAIQETAALLKGRLPVLDWDQLKTELPKSAPCLAEAAGTFALCLPHARTDAVSSMVISVGVSKHGILFSGCAIPVRYVFCIALPKALASDYLRVVGLLVRILKDTATEAGLRSALTGADFVQRLMELEVKM